MSELDFDAFLTEATNAEVEEKSRQRLEGLAMLEIDAAIDACGVQTAFRFSGESRETHRLIAESDVRERMYSDGAQLRRLHATICVLRSDDSEMDPSFHKKLMTAELFAHAGCDENSPWVMLADRLMPGIEGLHFDSAKDTVFIRQALNRMVDRERRKQLFSDIVIGRLKMLIERVEGDTVETDGYVRTLARCAAMYVMNKTQQEAAVDETAFETGLSRSEVEHIRDAYAIYYETAGSYFPAGLL